MRYISMNEAGEGYARSTPEWDYNIETDLFEHLENDFDIIYMPIDEHYGVWCNIDSWRYEIEHMKGLQKYLSYCRKNDITSERIDNSLDNKVDVMDLYQEENQGYKIINSITCGKHAVVLGYKANSYTPYVTWRKKDYKVDSYDLGHYFDDYKKAYKDFETRCHDMMDNQLANEKKFIHLKKRQQER